MRCVAALLLLLALAAGAARAQTPCGYAPAGPGEPPVAWYVEDGDGRPRPCDQPPPPTPQPPPTPPPLTPQARLLPVTR